MKEIYIRLFAISSALVAASLANVAAAQEGIGNDVVVADEDPTPAVEVSWGDDVSLGPLSGLEKLTVLLESTVDETVSAEVYLVSFGDGDLVETNLGKRNLKSGQVATIKLPVSKIPVVSSDFSVQVALRILVTMPNGQALAYHSEPRYFHVDATGNAATVYNELQMIDEFNGGDLWGGYALAATSSSDETIIPITVLGRADEADLEEAEMAVAEIGYSATETSIEGVTPLTAYSVQVCGHWRTWFEDANLGEDVWTYQGYYDRAARNTYAKVMQGSTVKWSGYLDDQGCTPTLNLGIGFYSLVQSSTISDGSTTYHVWGCSYYIGQGYICAALTTTKGFAVSSSGPIDVFPTSTGGWVNANALVGWLMESPDSGKASGTTEVNAGETCPSYENSSCWSSYNNTIYLSSNGVDLKFVIAHEVGHQSQYDRIGTLGSGYSEPVPESDWQCRCDHVTSSNQAHCLQSREAIDTAILEGFGYFFSANLFNDETEDDCAMAHSKELLIPHPLYPEDPELATLYNPPVIVDCREPVQWQETWCDDSDTGTEWDWMNFFWEWHSGGGSGDEDYTNRATMSDIYASINDAEYWDDVLEGAFARFGSNDFAPKFLFFQEVADLYEVAQ